MTIHTIRVQKDVMARNDLFAARVRVRLAEAGVPAFDLISSPGSGKTTLLERTLAALDEEIPMAVVAGDVRTTRDAERLARHTARVVQAVETEGGCHLDARQILMAVEALDLDAIRLLWIENVGNLVCPAGFDLGETAKVVMLSVTEGDDKPLKYPNAFRRSRYAVLNKIDLLSYVDFDVERAIGYAREVNPDIEIFPLSARSGEGMDAWLDFVRSAAAVPAGV
jgi:hydrogenase nickel incorporation protein HypB